MSAVEKRNSRELFEERIKKSLRIDARYSVLDLKFSNGYLNIFTDSLSNAMHISAVYQKSSPRFRIKVVLLPDKSVGQTSKGICHVGTASVRRSPSSGSEQVTQVLYGETFDTLQTEKGWVRIRLHADGYTGWVSADQVTLMSDDRFYDFQFLPRVYAADNVVEILESPSRKSHAVREAVFGCALRYTGNHGSYMSVRLPDGIRGWVERSCVTHSLRPGELSVPKLIDTARKFLGISYEWGGRSSRGFDCSGFVQAVFRFNGISLPRDTDMQFLAGKKVGKSPRRLRAGDLLFFSSNGHKISHVAIYTGKNKEFIHSSGFVRINSLDRKRKNYSKKLSSTFVGACRVI